MSENNIPGKLKVIVGPMFSGKTSRLIEQYNKNKLNNIPTMVINYSEDNRFSDTHLSSHDNIEIPCIKLTNLSEIYKYLNSHFFVFYLKKYTLIFLEVGKSAI